MSRRFSIGLDFGTNSVRALLVDIASGEEIATAVHRYQIGEEGIVIDLRHPDLARQHPSDYLDGTVAVVEQVLAAAQDVEGFSPSHVVGVGVDATASTPLPLDENGEPLAFADAFRDDPDAMAWLWKDHTSFVEAAEITERAAAEKPEYLAKCGGTYSSEWFWSKMLHCARVAPRVMESAFTWVELADWIPAVLTGTIDPGAIRRGICAAGHKGMFHRDWGGYPDSRFLEGIHPELARVRCTLPDAALSVADCVGNLTREWSLKLGLLETVVVAAGTIDAHAGAIGCGIRPGVWVKIMGTSSCDLMVAPLDQQVPDIPGLCGIVPESILPGHHGLEAGQSAVGDVYNWFVNSISPGGLVSGSHEALTEKAKALEPGESGLLALDWLNGNRTILVDPRLTGAILGLNLQTRPEELYLALIEATAFGTRAIGERLAEYGVQTDRLVACGGIATRNPFVMQVFADVLGKRIEVSRSEQTSALGAAMAGAVAAGAHPDFLQAARAMTGIRGNVYTPDPLRVAVYDRLYPLYRRIHDLFGVPGTDGNAHHVMKELLAIRDEVRRAKQG